MSKIFLCQRHFRCWSCTVQFFHAFLLITHKQILGTNNFPALRLPENLLPKQVDGYNCGMGMVASIAIILRNVCHEKVDQMSFIEQFGQQARLKIHQDNENNVWLIFFDKRFFESISTKEDDLILADYLTMLCSEWFVVFECMAVLHLRCYRIHYTPKRRNTHFPGGILPQWRSGKECKRETQTSC